MNKTSKKNIVIISFILIIIGLILVILTTNFSKNDLGIGVSFLILMMGIIMFLGYMLMNDLVVTKEGIEVISIFSKSNYKFIDIEIISIKIIQGSFVVLTNVKKFNFAYTKENYRALKDILQKVNHSDVTLTELVTSVDRSLTPPK